MTRNKEKVFFNASVIIAGLYSKTGASAKLLKMAQEGDIKGVISEIVLDETVRHASKIGMTPEEIVKKVNKLGLELVSAPTKLSKSYKNKVKDPGDVHLFTSAVESQSRYLISLDKKHVLSLRDQIRKPEILSPGEFLQILEKYLKI